MSRRVLITEQFERAVESMSQHYLEWLSRFDGSGAALDRFLAALPAKILPMLLKHPGIGSLYRLPSHGVDTVTAGLPRLEQARAGPPLTVLRWPYQGFVLLYADVGDVLVLVSARHQQQQDFP